MCVAVISRIAVVVPHNNGIVLIFSLPPHIKHIPHQPISTHACSQKDLSISHIAPSRVAACVGQQKQPDWISSISDISKQGSVVRGICLIGWSGWLYFRLCERAVLPEALRVLGGLLGGDAFRAVVLWGWDLGILSSSMAHMSVARRGVFGVGMITWGFICGDGHPGTMGEVYSPRP